MGRLEFQAITKGDLQRNMKIAFYSDTIIPTLMPDYFKKIERLEGDGGAGTVKVATLGPSITGGPEVQVSEKTLVFDFDSGTIVNEPCDPRFRKLQTTVKVIPHENGKDCTTHWQIDYEPFDPSIPTPEEFKVAILKVTEAVRKYADQHPEWP